MVELKDRPNSIVPAHKNSSGDDCTCAFGTDHHKDSNGRDCSCFIWRDHHRDSKGDECTCKVGMNHNTKSSPHKDGDGRLCSGPFIIAILSGKRTCSWCRREESYSPTEIVIVFKKGRSVGEAGNFIMNFKLNDYAPVFVQDKARNVVEKNGLVAVTVAIPLAAGKMPEEWMSEAEKSELVWFASRVMVVSFSATAELTPETGLARRKRPGAPPDFPDELQEI